MLAYEMGYDVNPSTLNKIFTERGEYSNNDLLSANSLARVYNLPYEFAVDDYNYKGMSDIREQLKEHYVILSLDNDSNPANGTQSHFVVAVNCDTELYINDPVFGYIRFLDFYKEVAIQRVIRYNKDKVNPAEYEGQVIEFDNKAYIVENGTRRWSPDILTYFSYNRTTDEIRQVSGAVIQSLPNGRQLQYKESPNYKLFQNMREKNIIKF